MNIKYQGGGLGIILWGKKEREMKVRGSMTRNEYEKAISSFLMELQGTLSVLDHERINDSTDLISEIKEFKIRMSDTEIANADLVRYCFGIVDEYLKAFWKDNISAGFDLYQDLNFNKDKPT
jgi:hypothetical protein